MPKKRLFWLGLLAVAGAVFAIPTALFVTCQVRGDYVRGSDERLWMAEYLRHGLGSLLIGLAIGVPLTVIFILVRVLLPRRRDN